MSEPAKVLLISLNRYGLPSPVFPLGLSHLNAALTQAGYSTVWWDALEHGQSLRDFAAQEQPAFACLSLRNIDDIVIGQRESFYQDLASATRELRSVVGCPVIVGGSGFSIFPSELLAVSGADFGITGDGERGLVALLQALETNASYDSIPGLVFRRGEGIVINPPGSTGALLPLGPADRPDPLVRHYLETSGVLNLQTQRGCPFHCCYCTYPLIEGHQHRARAPEAVAEELQQLAGRGARYVFIVDSVFNAIPAHAAAVCEAILRRGVRLRWSCFLRPSGLDRELMRLMAKAGLAHIEFGSDSFSDTVLESYGKSFSFADILASSQMAADARVESCHFLICGGPGENEQTLDASFEQSMRLPETTIMAVIGMRVYPGTPLFRRALEEGSIQPETDLLNPTYYLAPALTHERVLAQLQSFARRSAQWIVGQPPPEYAAFARRLRQRGALGPLWSYLSTLQRLSPPRASN